jgi:hypothetical protein
MGDMYDEMMFKLLKQQGWSRWELRESQRGCSIRRGQKGFREAPPKSQSTKHTHTTCISSALPWQLLQK